MALLVRLVVVVMLAGLVASCTTDEPPRPATAVAVQPTVPRPVLVTPSIVVSAIPTTSPVPLGDTYTVAGGDTLSSIAERFYSDATAWEPIFQANRDRLTSPEALQVGMTLRIPPRPRP